MFVALKNWRERLLHQGASAARDLSAVERALEAGGLGSQDLLRQFRAAALAPAVRQGRLPARAELGPQFADAEPLSRAENLSIMASVERGAARQARKKRRS